MSQENIKTVLDTTAAFNRGDLDTWSEYWTDDIDYRAVEGAVDDHGPIHGKDAYALTCRTGSTLTFAVLYTIRDGKIARGCEYMTRDEALEAAGLSE